MMRNPVVAGRFYPGSSAELAEYLRGVLPIGREMRSAIGIVSPHAGYVYSGGVAASVIGSVFITDTVLLLGPNHTGKGTRASIMSSGSWRTPLGVTDIDEGLAQALREGCPTLREDSVAHEEEHSLEVQLPFLQFIKPGVKIVPISFSLRSGEEILQVGRELGEVLASWPEPVLMLASSDMTHYESDDEARVKDRLAIDKVLALDPGGLLSTVGEHNISMCGVVPTAIMLAAAKVLGASGAREVRYATSGEVTGDYSSVVGYAGMVVD